MRLQRSHSEARNRRGMILLIVLVMLTMFAIAGLTFVLYAESAAESARINRSSETFTATSLPDMDPNTSFSLFMGQLVYGVADPSPAPGGDPNSGNSALRGHSLAETMYGSFDAVGGAPMDVPYSAPGRLHEPGVYPLSLPDDGYNMVNYTYFQNADPTFLRDPGRTGSRNAASVNKTSNGRLYIGQNAPYTFPDVNSMFLASINAATGKINTPSYLRPNVFNNEWTTAAGKYKTLRPRPQEMGPGFPMPDPTTGCDVQNLTGSQGGNDSIWIDINAPVLTTASGLRYKMLVAPLILDLDNRINLNVVGNILASGNGHASNQGWGPWEINMSKVLNFNATEWNQLFLNNNGRYGNGHQPLATFVPLGPTPHAYAKGDLNGTLDPAPNTVTGLYTLPTAGSIGAFPTFPAGYGNGVQETTNSGGAQIHPMFFNPMFAVAGNNLFSIQNNASLLWAGPAFSTTDLHTLCPNNYLVNDTTTNTTRRINQTTVLSMDLDRGGAAPYVFDASNPPYGITYNTANGQYTYAGSPQSFPVLPSSRTAVQPANSEFDPNTWQSVLARTLPRIDLDRQLAVYPASGVQPPDRQQFAMDIYTRLVAVTGLTAANKSLGTMNPPAPAQYNSLRWLAQLSANIVDYIDTDDVMTQFQWTNAPTAPDTGFVFGTELPKLVLNEVYFQYNNDPTDKFPKNGMNVQTASLPYQMNVWAELLNPLPSTAETAPNPANNATLQDASGKAIYQLVLSKPNQGLRNADNILGNPDGPTPPNAPYATQPYTPSGTYVTAGGSQVLTAVNNWGAGAVAVAPMGQNFGNGANASAGFFVVGPQTAASGALPAPTFQSPSMTYTVNFDPAQEVTANAPAAPTLLLQRLANPNLLYNGTPGPGYNPYVTVDYVDLNPLAGGGPPPINPAINDARTYTSTGPVGNAPTPTNFFSYGRNEPYASLCNAKVSNQWQPQQRSPKNAAGPQNSFFQQNVNANTPGPNDAAQAGFTVPANYPAFDWLVHLDRPLISPIELLHVSGFKPHELTQQFIDAAGQKLDPSGHGHYAPWTDPTGNSRLYRLLEFVKTKNPTPGIASGGRVPGKININTLDPTSIEVFRALCDAQTGNTFSYNNGTYTGDGPGTYVDNVFGKVMAARSANGPFWGMAQGTDPGSTQYPTGTGLSNTLFGAAAAAGGPPGATHPYQNLELLNKIYNNLTTRSNCFAVWLTVGFFPVTNDTVQPNQLGPEINLAQGKNIRHHMFAIVDRTQVQTWKTGALQTNVAIAAGNGVSIGVPTSVNDSRTGVTWQIQDGTTPAASPLAGSTLVYDPGAGNEETVVVQPGFVANFTQNHIKGANVISRGHPGPWNLPGNLKYDATQDTSVVPYFKLID